MDTVTEIPYTEFGAIAADPTDPAAAVEHFGLLKEMTEDTINAVFEVARPESGSHINIAEIRHLQGAFSRPPAVSNAVGACDAAFAVFALTVVPPGERRSPATWIPAANSSRRSRPGSTRAPIPPSWHQVMPPSRAPAGPTIPTSTTSCAR